jgi:hypothetical protein
VVETSYAPLGCGQTTLRSCEFNIIETVMAAYRQTGLKNLSYFCQKADFIRQLISRFRIILSW